MVNGFTPSSRGRNMSNNLIKFIQFRNLAEVQLKHTSVFEFIQF